MPSPTEQTALVAALLASYAERGQLRGFTRGPATASRAEFQLHWHRGQTFDLRFEPRTGKLRIARVLPNLDPGSAMYRQFRHWLKGRGDAALPAHRRCDPDKAALRPYNRTGDVALTLQVLDGDLDYGVRRLVAVVNEIYLDFLGAGEYFEWLVETFDLDPDNPY